MPAIASWDDDESDETALPWEPAALVAEVTEEEPVPPWQTTPVAAWDDVTDELTPPAEDAGLSTQDLGLLRNQHPWEPELATADDDRAPASPRRLPGRT